MCKTAKAQKVCLDCGAPIAFRNNLGRCQTCQAKATGKLFKCIRCGTDFARRGNSNNLYCSRQCAFEVQSELGHTTKGIAARKRRSFTITFCQYCSEPLVGIHGGRQELCMCHVATAERLNRKAKAKKKSYKKLQERPVACADCGAPIETKWKKIRRRCRKCSNARANLAKHTRLKNAFDEHVAPIAVYRRDNWTCQLCGQKVVKRKAAGFDPMAPSLDHIVPLSKGGRHSYANVQCAHVGCNMRKGARLRGQLRLFG